MGGSRLSDPRKARITSSRLLNHTSGICLKRPAPKRRFVGIHPRPTAGERARPAAFDPGTACGAIRRSALAHAALDVQTVTASPTAIRIEALFKPLGVERWWFQYYDGGEKIGRHPSAWPGPARRRTGADRLLAMLAPRTPGGERQVDPAMVRRRNPPRPRMT